MNLWILTIGSSDVQLISDKVNQAKERTEKQRSDKVWSYWYTEDLRADCYDISFEPKQTFRDKEEAYRISPRILGGVYQASDKSRQQEIWDYLTFPLLDNFAQALQDYPAPEAISVLLTDQSTIFESDRQRKPNSPYWQDTCELKPILQNYFVEKFPDSPCEFIPLIPKSETESLDNWNAVLDLVRDKFRNLTIAEQPIQVNPQENVYVSHQAGTPAISSAVQFCSLAKFGDRVKFLVSNEYNPSFPEKPLEGSSYLRGIRIQEAKALLGEGSYNYAGVEALIGDYIQENENVTTLLNAAKNWNVAKFSDFLDCLKHHPKFASEVAERTREENWWWIAYEEAYLAVIRVKQDNIVEAFFHSFRVFEYIFAEWGKQKLTKYIEESEDGGVPFLRETLLDDPRILGLSGKSKKSVSGIISKLKVTRDNQENANTETDVEIIEGEKVEFVFFNLANLFKSFNYKEYKSECQELEVFFGKDNVRDKRNIIVHQAEGLSIENLCDFWGISISEDSENADDLKKHIAEWEKRLLKLLNFIVKEDFSEGFATLKEASLMAKVHEELERAIAHL